MKTNETFMSALQWELKHNMRKYSMFIVLFCVWLFFHLQQINNSGIFITPKNISNLFLQASYITVLAVGMVLVIVAGHIDLSIGSIAGFTGAIAAILQYNGSNTIVAILAALLVGIVIGYWQGFWIAYMKVPAFIVTLAGMTVFRGGLLLITQGKTISVDGSFRAFGIGRLPYLSDNFPTISFIIFVAIGIFIVYHSMKMRKYRIEHNFSVHPRSFYIFSLVIILVSYSFIAYQLMSNVSKNIHIKTAGISYITLLMFILAAIFHFIANNTRFGRHVYAIGGNKEAARLSGVNIERTNLYIFVLMGFLSAVAGIIFTASLGSASSSAGNLFELDTIAAAIIGGTSTLGGEGTIVGAIVGAILMTSLNTGMQLMNIGNDWQQIIRGLVLLLAVFFDIMSRRK